MKYLYMYLFIINVITFIMYCTDKFLAKKHLYRIPERLLFLMAVLGGSIGGLLGMFLSRHKTKKVLFYFWNIMSLGIWIYFLFFQSV